jgi:hypothetical protein
MGLRPLGPRWLRRIERITGLTVVHGSGGGGYDLNFTTDDHRHGQINATTKEWFVSEGCPGYTSCQQLFPNGDGR